MSTTSRMSAVLGLALLPGCQLFELAAITSSYPPLDGELTVEGADDAITVVRDAAFVAHVTATTEHDAWFGQGFVHGQDRYWQADLNRHLAFGRVSEWLGEGAASLDGFMQGMELDDRGKALFAAQSDEAKAMFQAYADGMNAGLASLGNDPIEYRLLQVEPEPWTATDAYGVLFLMAWNLTENPAHETAAYLLRDALDARALSDLYAFHPDVPDVDAWWGTVRQLDAGEFNAGFEAFTSSLGGRPDAGEASNNWVLGPSKSASGTPVLANDPHLGQRVPSLWHASHVRAPGLEAAGVTLPGVPGFPIGHTGDAAWGLTNVMADVVDFAILERAGDDGYVLAGETKSFTEVTAQVDVGLDEPITKTTTWTELGPVVTTNTADHVMAMQWHAFTVDDRLPEALYALAHSHSVDDLLDALDRPLMLAQNVALADAAGSFGYQSAGSVPRRVGMTGRTPYLASQPGIGWDGWLEGLPGERDTARGYVHTANTRPTSTQSADGDVTGIDVDAITTAWVAPHRDTRIREMLERPGPFDADDVRRQQLDLLDVTARRLVPWLLEGVATPGDATACVDELKAWDFRWTTDSAGAAVWSRMHPAITRRTVNRWLDEEQTALFLASVGTGRGMLDARIEDLLSQAREQVVAEALVDACDDLTEQLGPDPAGWSWGEMHPLELKHPVADGQGILGYWHMRPVPWSGSGATVNAASYDLARDDRGVTPVTGMASVRFVIDLADPDGASMTYPGGQIGAPTHPGYASHYEAFVAGETVPLPWHDVEASHTLTLRP